MSEAERLLALAGGDGARDEDRFAALLLLARHDRLRSDAALVEAVFRAVAAGGRRGFLGRLLRSQREPAYARVALVVTDVALRACEDLRAAAETRELVALVAEAACRAPAPAAAVLLQCAPELLGEVTAEAAAAAADACLGSDHDDCAELCRRLCRGPAATRDAVAAQAARVFTSTDAEVGLARFRALAALAAAAAAGAEVTDSRELAATVRAVLATKGIGPGQRDQIVVVCSAVAPRSPRWLVVEDKLLALVYQTVRIELRMLLESQEPDLGDLSVGRDEDSALRLATVVGAGYALLELGIMQLDAEDGAWAQSGDEITVLRAVSETMSAVLYFVGRCRDGAIEMTRDMEELLGASIRVVGLWMAKGTDEYEVQVQDVLEFMVCFAGGASPDPLQFLMPGLFELTSDPANGLVVFLARGASLERVLRFVAERASDPTDGSLDVAVETLLNALALSVDPLPQVGGAALAAFLDAVAAAPALGDSLVAAACLVLQQSSESPSSAGALIEKLNHHLPGVKARAGQQAGQSAAEIVHDLAGDAGFAARYPALRL